MSTIHARVADGIKAAMKGKDMTSLNVLRGLKSALTYAATEKYGAEGELAESDAVAVVRKEIKKRQDAVDAFTKAGRTELAGKESHEKSILESFLPQPLNESELDTMVAAAIAETGATTRAQLGSVIKLVQERAAGRADGRAISQAVMKALNA